MIKKKVSDRRIAFCFKLWVKELKKSRASKATVVQTIINMADNEILDGSYCSDKEYKNYIKSNKVIPHDFPNIPTDSITKNLSSILRCPICQNYGRRTCKKHGKRFRS